MKWIWFLPICLLATYFSMNALSASENKLADYKRLDVRSGDVCIVSGRPLKSNDIVIELQGRRVGIEEECLESFLKNPEKYFAKLQPKSALFTEEMEETKQLSLGYFVFGLYVLVGLIFAALSSHMAVAKGLSPVRWFFAGLVFAPFAYLMILMKKGKGLSNVPAGFRKVHTTADPIHCPVCGAENHPSATNCLNCKTKLEPRAESEVRRVSL